MAKTVFYSLAALVCKILFGHSKIKFIRSRHRIISSMYLLLLYRLLHALWIKLTLQQGKNCAHMIIRRWKELSRYTVSSAALILILLFEGRPSQLYMQLMQLRKEDLKKNSGLYGIQTLDLCDTGAALYQLS